MAISDEFLAELRDKIGIEEVISPYVRLKRRGRTLVGLCPFHNEKTPSFTVYPDNNSFYCFGCGAGGDIITFVRRIENMDYVEAVKSLAQRAGMRMPEDGFDDSLAKARRRMLAANREAARFFHQCLYAECGKAALHYLLQRGLTHQTIKHFGLGYAPDSWDSLLRHLRDLGYTPAELFDANLVRKSERDGRTSYYDNFRNRFMTPIIDVRGNVIAFGGRVLDDSKPKYVNTSDTLVYKKSRHVFALNFAKNGNDGKLILAEGYMDVIALHQAGFTNAVAGLGTALTREQVSLLRRYADEIILSYDADEAGQAAANKAIALFEETDLKLKVIHLSGGKDPDEILKKYGPERFRSLIDGAANDIEFRLISEQQKYDLTTDDGKLQYLKGAAAILASTGDPIVIDLYASRLAEQMNINKDNLLAQIAAIDKRRRGNRQREQYRRGESILENQRKTLGGTTHLRAARAEETLLASLLGNPDYYPRAVKGKLQASDFQNELYGRLFAEITARLEEGKPIELTMLSAVFPPEEMGAITRLFGQERQMANTEAECADCARVILEEKHKSEAVDPAAMSTEEWLKNIQNLKK